MLINHQINVKNIKLEGILMTEIDERNLEELVIGDIKASIKRIFNITGVKIEFDTTTRYMYEDFHANIKLTFDHKSYVVTFSNALIKADYPFRLDYKTFYMDIYCLMAFILQKYNKGE
jgi:hypothetical protein